MRHDPRTAVTSTNPHIGPKVLRTMAMLRHVSCNVKITMKILCRCSPISEKQKYHALQPTHVSLFQRVCTFVDR